LKASFGPLKMSNYKIGQFRVELSGPGTIQHLLKSASQILEGFSFYVHTDFYIASIHFKILTILKLAKL
jgi:hypothetical protein